MRVIILLNSAAGTEGSPQGSLLQQLFDEAGMSVEIRTTERETIAAAAQAAVAESPDVVVAAGGDGTVSVVAAAILGSAVTLGVLPLGTLNHFAKDIGVGPDLPAAVRVIAEGHVQNLDVGQVNGQPFINNSSIGLYPHMVNHRHRQQLRLGRGKWLAMFFAALAVFRRYPLIQVVLKSAGQVFPRITPFVFIGNNRYQVNLLALGARPRLDGGELSVYFANRTGRFGLLRLMLRALFGRLDQAKDFDILLTHEVRIDTPKRSIHVAMDGEVRTMTPPLNYQILPRALKVLTPRNRRPAAS